MFKEIVKKAAAIVHCSFIPVVRAGSNEPENLYDDNVFARLKTAVTPTNYQAVTPEVASFINWTQNGIVYGTPMGAIIHAKTQYMDFMENARASHYKWHFEAKADLTKKMIQGAARGATIWGIKGTILTSTYGLLINLIPVLRNEHGWSEFIIAGVITGVLGGHLFSDRKELGFEEIKMKGRLTYRQMSFVKGVGFGLFFGLFAAVFANVKDTRSATLELKKWEKYWKQRRQKKESNDVKADG